MFCFKCKNNEIVNKLLLPGDKFMPEMHLKQPGFTYSACSLFQKTKKELCRLEIQILFTEMSLIRVAFSMIWPMENQVLRDKAFKVANDLKYDRYQRGLASMVYKFFEKKSCVANELNYQIGNELHKQIIRKLKRRKFYSFFRDHIWGIDLADMQSLRKYNKGIKYLLCAIDSFSKYAWVVSLKDKRGNIIVNAFQEIIKKGRKLNKIWVDQVGEFYNNLFKRFLRINNIEMYSTNNEGKSVIAERFSRTLKSKIFKHMTAISKNVYLDVLDNIFDKYNNTVH